MNPLYFPDGLTRPNVSIFQSMGQFKSNFDMIFHNWTNRPKNGQMNFVMSFYPNKLHFMETPQNRFKRSKDRGDMEKTLLWNYKAAILILYQRDCFKIFKNRLTLNKLSIRGI
jgi:hypothetical protein